MSKREVAPTTIVCTVPAAMVTCIDGEGNPNIITIAWVGTVNTKPPMVSISVAKGRHSYSMIKERGEFVINLTTEGLALATDFCGVNSGKNTDKFKETGLTPVKASKVGVPIIKEAPVAIECVLKSITELGSHDLFIGDVVAVTADEEVIDEGGKLRPGRAGLICFINHEYWSLKEAIGRSGYSRRANKQR